MFGGWNRRYKHTSSSLGCDMTFSIYFPPGADAGKVPVLYYLSGLTCTDENVMIKSGVQRSCAEQGIAFVAPDTSPRGLNVEGESESWVRACLVAGRRATHVHGLTIPLAQTQMHNHIINTTAVTINPPPSCIHMPAFAKPLSTGWLSA